MICLSSAGNLTWVEVIFFWFCVILFPHKPKGLLFVCLDKILNRRRPKKGKSFSFFPHEKKKCLFLFFYHNGERNNFMFSLFVFLSRIVTLPKPFKRRWNKKNNNKNTNTIKKQTRCVCCFVCFVFLLFFLSIDSQWSLFFFLSLSFFPPPKTPTRKKKKVKVGKEAGKKKKSKKKKTRVQQN